MLLRQQKTEQKNKFIAKNINSNKISNEKQTSASSGKRIEKYLLNKFLPQKPTQKNLWMELGNEEKNKGYNKNLSQYKVLRAAGSLEERERESKV